MGGSVGLVGDWLIWIWGVEGGVGRTWWADLPSRLDWTPNTQTPQRLRDHHSRRGEARDRSDGPPQQRRDLQVRFSFTFLSHTSRSRTNPLPTTAEPKAAPPPQFHPHPPADPRVFSVEHQTQEDLESIFNVNIKGVLRLTQKWLPTLRAVQGRIVMVSSVAGKCVPMRAPPIWPKTNRDTHRSHRKPTKFKQHHTQNLRVYGDPTCIGLLRLEARARGLHRRAADGALPLQRLGHLRAARRGAVGHLRQGSFSWIAHDKRTSQSTTIDTYAPPLNCTWIARPHSLTDQSKRPLTHKGPRARAAAPGGAPRGEGGLRPPHQG